LTKGNLIGGYLKGGYSEHPHSKNHRYLRPNPKPSTVNALAKFILWVGERSQNLPKFFNPFIDGILISDSDFGERRWFSRHRAVPFGL
jgi:hypothetical protein